MHEELLVGLKEILANHSAIHDGEAVLCQYSVGGKVLT